MDIYYTGAGQFELKNSAQVKSSRFTTTGSGKFEAFGSADAYIVGGNLRDRTIHYYQFNNNLNDSIGNFNLILDGNFTSSSPIGPYGTSTTPYPFQLNGDKDSSFYSGSRFALTFRFNLASISNDKLLLRINSDLADVGGVKASLLITFKSLDKKIYLGQFDNLISDTVILPDTWYFVSIIKINTSIRCAINAGSLKFISYPFSTPKFKGIECQNNTVSGDLSELRITDIRFYNNPITFGETIYLYNNGTPLIPPDINQALLYNDEVHAYNFDRVDRYIPCCYLISDLRGSSDIILYAPEYYYDPFVEGVFEGAVQVGKNYLSQAGLYDYAGYAYTEDDIIGNNSFTISFWYKLLGPSVGNIDPTDSLPFSPTLSITTNTGEVIFGIKEKSNTLSFILENTYFPDAYYEVATWPTISNWVHIAFVYDKSLQVGYLYFEGKLVKSFAYTKSLAATALFIGYNNYANNFKSKKSLITESYCEAQGIEALLTYNVAITSWDITTIYGCGVNANIDSILNVNYNTGTLPTKLYRFEADCMAYDSEGKLTPANSINAVCEYANFLNVGASTLTDACQQLLNQGYDFELTSVGYWSNDATFEQTKFADGKYVPITNYCSDHKCFEFCVQYRTNVSITAQVFGLLSTDFINGSGKFELTGSAKIKRNLFKYTGSGIVNLNSSALVTLVGGVSGTACVATGGISVNGLAIVDSSDLGLYNVNINSDIAAVEVNLFNVALPGNTLLGSNGLSSLSQCGCQNLPFEFNSLINLANKNNLFLQFLNRNGLTVPTVVIFNYNKTALKYLANFRYQGISTVGNQIENWYVVFELYCVGAKNQFTNTFEWNYTMQITQKTSVKSSESKVLVKLNNLNICPTNGIPFNLTFTSNLLTKLTTVNGNSFYPNSVIINDRLGLFNTADWINSPNLDVTIGTT